MRKLISVAVILLVVLIAGLAINMRKAKMPEDYEIFISEGMKIRFEYPRNWHLNEIKKPGGNILGEVQIFGPRREDLKYSIFLDVNKTKLSANQGENNSLEKTVENIITQRKKQPTYNVISKTKAKIDKSTALETDASFIFKLPIGEPNQKTTLMREISAYTLHKGSLFCLSFVAPSEDFEKHKEAFQHLKKSFAFLP
jgi:hypothetical protein